MGNHNDNLDGGFQIHRGVFQSDEIDHLRLECDAISYEAGTACVRHLRAKSGALRQLASDPRLLAILPEGYQVVRSILFDKTVEENWPVAWHQDLTISVKQQVDLPDYGPWSIKDGAIHVQPPEEVLKNMVTLRIHLDETPATNGALRVIPDSHLLGRASREERSKKDEVVCECRPGDVLAMSPLILHASSRSLMPSRRRIIHFEYAAPQALHPKLDWAEKR